MGNSSNYLEGLKQRHRVLDTRVEELMAQGLPADEFEIRSLKLKKLNLKEEIERLEKESASKTAQSA